jgi:hypothetical protein
MDAITVIINGGEERILTRAQVRQLVTDDLRLRLWLVGVDPDGRLYLATWEHLKELTADFYAAQQATPEMVG